MSQPLAPGIASPDAFADECHYFALALLPLSGGGLAYVCNRGRDGDPVPGHVVVTLAPGVHADASGIWAEDDLLAAWGAAEVVPVARDEVVRDLGGRLSRWARTRVAAADAAIGRADAFLEACALARDDEPSRAPAPR